MVYFTDGRTMRLDPSTRIFVGNREMRLADVEPGWEVVVKAPAPDATAAEIDVVWAPAASMH